MRRPLFSNGIPLSVLDADNKVTVFDATDVTPQEAAPHVFAVTLFVWGWQDIAPFSSPTALPSLVVTVGTEGDDGVAIAQLLPGDFEAHEIASIGDSGRATPIKILDRYILRGDQQLYIENVNATNESCFVYGFVEMDGESNISLPFRPLQPAALEEPFSALPSFESSVGPADESSVVAHKLSATYVDALVLNVNVVLEVAAETESPSVNLTLPDGTTMPLPTLGGTGAFLSQPFDGIPMLAPTAADNSVSVTIGACVAGASAAVAAYGGFRRG